MITIQPAFGAIQRPQSVSDIVLGSAVTPVAIPDTFLPTYTKYTDMQSLVPCCGAGAGKALKEVFTNIAGTPTHLSMKCLWDEIKSFDGYPYDSGTDLLSIMKALNKFGVATEATMPTNCIGADPVAFTAHSNVTPAIATEAATHKIDLGYAFQWSPTFQQIKEAIYQHKAVVLLMQVGAEFWTGANGVSSWQAKDILPLSPNFPIESGHFVLAYGYDLNNIYFYNQWSTAWGQDGVGYFGANYAKRVVEIGTAVDLKKILLTASLKFGSRGSDVSLLQKKLGIPVDGIFGNQTKNAVVAFQTAHGLTPDGIVGPLTNAQLNNL